MKLYTTYRERKCSQTRLHVILKAERQSHRFQNMQSGLHNSQSETGSTAELQIEWQTQTEGNMD